MLKFCVLVLLASELMLLTVETTKKHSQRREFKKFKTLQKHSNKVLSKFKPLKLQHLNKTNRNISLHAQELSRLVEQLTSNNHQDNKADIASKKKRKTHHHTRTLKVEKLLNDLRVHNKNKVQSSKKGGLANLAGTLRNANISVENHVHSHTTKTNIGQKKVFLGKFAEALKGANLSIENHVHSHTTKSNINNKNIAAPHHVLDALKGANISVENHVHTHTAKSEISDQHNGIPRGLFDAFKNANISVENHVHSYSVNYSEDKSKPKRRHAIANLAEALKNANISVQNSVHSYTLKSTVKRKGRVDVTGVKNGRVDVTGVKRDEEPLKHQYDVHLSGKNAFDVAAEIENNDKHLIPMLSSASTRELQKYDEENHDDDRTDDEEPEYIASDKDNFPDEYDPFNSEDRRHHKNNREHAYGADHDRERDHGDGEERRYNDDDRHRHSEQDDIHERRADDRESEPERQHYEGRHHDNKHQHGEGRQHYEEHQDDEGRQHYDERQGGEGRKHDDGRQRDEEGHHSDRERNEGYEERNDEYRVKDKENHGEEYSPYEHGLLVHNLEEHPPLHGTPDLTSFGFPSNSYLGGKEREHFNNKFHNEGAHDQLLPGNMEFVGGPGGDHHNSEASNGDGSDHGHNEEQRFHSHPLNQPGSGGINPYVGRLAPDNMINALHGCINKKDGICRDDYGELHHVNNDYHVTDYHTNDHHINNEHHLSNEERMIQFQRNPFDPHDININEYHDLDEKQHEAIPAPLPQSVLQIGIDPSVNLHYVTHDEDHDIHYDNELFSHHNDEGHHGNNDHHENDHHIDLHSRENVLYHDAPHQEYEGEYAAHAVRFVPHDNPHEVEHREYDHAPHDHIHDTTDHGNYDWDHHGADQGHGHIDREHQGWAHGGGHHENGGGGSNGHEVGHLYEEQDHTYPSTPLQAPYVPMFTPPQRELPMFQVGHVHHDDYHHHSHNTEGSRRTTQNTLNTGQAFEFGNRDYASYLNQHLGEYLKQASYDYEIMGLQTHDIGIATEMARKRKLENDAQIVLNATEILKQLQDNSTNITILDATNSTTDKNSSKATDTMLANINNTTKANRVNNKTESTNATQVIDSDKTSGAGVRKQIIPENKFEENTEHLEQDEMDMIEDQGKYKKAIIRYKVTTQS